MKGVILSCLKSLVTEKFGADKWKEIMDDSKAGHQIFTTLTDVDEKLTENIINSTCKVLKISLLQAAEAFGDHWMNNYASKMYSSYISDVKSSKDLFLKLDKIHEMVTKNVQNAKPPRFTYEWKDDKTLIMTYNSKRNMTDLFFGLAKSVGKFYKDYPKISKTSGNKFQIQFS